MSAGNQSKIGHALQALRKTKSGGRNGGRPRSPAPRCYCGLRTLSSARQRSFDCCKRAGKYAA